ncbi:PI-PLC X domain-containing protein 2 isoform X2 [Rhinatrema bivittatum]|uniref:PI-PLC X domain-containing protein 2 isoform X2 n=1 Tax=Rhinatrema bivittatum TaxID=194408 RepID=UPI00112EB5B2|nr:PI-PLC X domain-containing protein 2 isoform X2 [Rhinatrema bivittatum]
MAEKVPADWMGSLGPGLSALPLANLAIPGSHDSFSFWVDEESPIGADQAASVRRLARIALVKKLIKKWSVTQSLTFKEQLESGIRYFDLRVSSRADEAGEEIYFLHGLFGMKVRDGLTAINTFLRHHGREVVFLDFNHFYAMTHGHHTRLIDMLQEIFGSKLGTAEHVENVTLQSLWKKGVQVLVFYHSGLSRECAFLWPGRTMPAPWANTTSVQELLRFLESALSERSKLSTFHVSQAILTPRLHTVLRGFKAGLKDTLVHRTECSHVGDVSSALEYHRANGASGCTWTPSPF